MRKKLLLSTALLPMIFVVPAFAQTVTGPGNSTNSTQANIYGSSNTDTSTDGQAPDTIIGLGNTVNGTNAGTPGVASGAATVTGVDNNSTGKANVADGENINQNGNGNTGVGAVVNQTGAFGTALGSNTSTAGAATAVGAGATASGAQSLAVGLNATAAEASSSAIGAGSTENSGDLAASTGGGGINLGSSTTTVNAAATKVVSFGNSGGGTTGTSALEGVADGTVNSTSTQAVNGSQLYQTDQGVNAAYGEGATAETDAQTGIANAAAAQTTANTAITNAAAAQTTASTAETDAQTGISKANAAQTTANAAVTNAAAAQTTASTAQAAANEGVKYDQGPAGNTDSVTLVGANDGGAVAIHNVANGTATNDAVNFGQLSAVQTTANTAETDAQTGISKANAAQTTANTAITNAAAAQTTASTAETDAQTGISKANAAQTSANIAETNAQTGIANAATAQTTANTAETDAQTGISKANAAQTSANTAETNAQTGIANAATAQTTANTAISDANEGVKYDQGPAGNTDSVTLVGANDGSAVAIHNVANGTTASDAVNYGQLAAVDQTAESGEYYAETTINQLNNGTIGLVQQTGGNSNAPITVGANTGGTEVNIAGTAGDRELTGIAAGTTTDSAVNLGQLDATSQADRSYTNGAIAQLQSADNGQFASLNQEVGKVSKLAKGIGAIAMANSDIRYDNNPSKISLGLGAGEFAGQFAESAGLGWNINDKFRVTGSVSMISDASEVGFGLGVTYTLN